MLPAASWLSRARRQSRGKILRIGIDLGGTKISGVALDNSGAVLAHLRTPTPRDDYPGTIEAIRLLVGRLEADSGAANATVGVSMPGALSLRTGLVKNANSTWLNGRTFDRDLASALGRPVRVANDANCLAVSEATDGAGAGAHVVLAVILGTGCGGGIAIDGAPVTGFNAIAGEWGHNPLPWPTADELPGRACYCGKRGCIESWLSGPGMAADHRFATGVDLTAAAIAEAAEAGDGAARATIRISSWWAAASRGSPGFTTVCRRCCLNGAFPTVCPRRSRLLCTATTAACGAPPRSGLAAMTDGAYDSRGEN
jgi:fructokinase